MKLEKTQQSNATQKRHTTKLFRRWVLGKKFTQKSFVLPFSTRKYKFIRFAASFTNPSKTLSLRYLKINDASIHRIQNMPESGDSTQRQSVRMCVPTSPYEQPQPHVRVCLSHLSFHRVYIIYRQMLHSAYIQCTFVFLCVTTWNP